MTSSDNHQAEAGEKTEPTEEKTGRGFDLDRRWLALLAALLVFLAYLPAVRYGFVWDDRIFLHDHPLYRDSNLRLSTLFQPFVISPNYFRPLALLTFVVELRLVGLEPTLFHLSNLLLHALNTALVALLALRLTTRRSGASTSGGLVLGAGLLYGLHPALIEGVAFVSSRFDLLMTAFALSALLADLALRGRPARPIGVGLAFLLAALSKEMALALALALPCWHLAYHGGRAGRLPEAWKRAKESGDLGVYAAVIVAGLVYLLVRYLSLGYLVVSTSEALLPVGSLGQRLFLFFKSMGGYGLLALWPFTSLSPIHYTERPVPVGDPWAWAGLALLGLLAAGLVWLVRRAPQAGWLALGGVLALLPVSNLLPLELGGGVFIAERFLLFPLALLVLAAVLLLRPLYGRESLARVGRFPWKQVIPGGWLALCVVALQLTLPHWREELSLWTWAAERAPRSSVPPGNLALEYVNQGAYARGLQLAQRAVDLDPEYADGHDYLGLALFNLGRYDEAQAAFEKAIELEPRNALFWNNLAGALREQGELGQAERVLLDQALPLNPNLPWAHLNLGIVYLMADRPDLAVAPLEEARRLLPPDQVGQTEDFLAQVEDPVRWLRLGDLLLVQGDPQGALGAFEQARFLGAHPADVAAGQSAALINLGAWQEAAALLQSALAAAPDDARLFNNLGVVAREQGDLEAARQYFSRAVELAPEWEQPRQNLEALGEP